MLLKAKLFRKIHSSRAPYLKKKKKSLYLLFSQYKKAHWLSSPNVWTLSKSPLKRRTTEENARRGQCRLPLPSGGEITCNPEKLREAGHGRTSSVHLFLYTVLLTFILFFLSYLFIFFLSVLVISVPWVITMGRTMGRTRERNYHITTGDTSFSSEAR